MSLTIHADRLQIGCDRHERSDATTIGTAGKLTINTAYGGVEMVCIICCKRVASLPILACLTSGLSPRRKARWRGREATRLQHILFHDRAQST
jgi:hypothetical protein